MCFFVQTNHTRKELLFLMFKEINLRNHSSLHKLFYSLFSLVLIVRNITNINSSISIKSTHNVTIAAAISISLAVALTAWGSISANAAMELPGAPNGLSKKMDDLEKSNHRLEVKLKEERKINIQNKNYIKKVFKENRKTNINIKKIINNKKIIKIIKHTNLVLDDYSTE